MAGWQTPSALTAGDEFASEEYTKLRDAILAAVFAPGLRIGGSRTAAVAGTGYQDAEDYLDFRVPDAASAGAVYNVYVDLLCEDASTTITPKIRNITDSSDAVVGSASSSTSWAEQTLSFTPVVGKKYRLMFVKSDDAHKCLGIGFLQRTAA